MKPTNIYIIDNDAVILKLYSNMLQSYEYNIKTYTSGYDFLGEYDSTVASCALIDVNMSEMSGLQLFREMKDRGILIPTIFMSGVEDLDHVSELFREGAFDFIEKPYMNQFKIMHTISKALTKDKTESLVRAKMVRCEDYLSRLSERETNILNLMVDGKSAKLIARDLDISYRTVETHMANIRMKTKLDTIGLIGKVLYHKIHMQ